MLASLDCKRCAQTLRATLRRRSSPPYAGSAYFFVEPQNSRDFPSDVVLAINAKGILVVDPETKDFLAEYPYSEVVTWGHSQQTFVLVVGNLQVESRRSSAVPRCGLHRAPL